jgi:RNA polymerase sigma factor (TIGR02999 family)
VADITQILNSIDAGDPTAAAQLLPLVYDELRRLAAVQMAHENPGHTLDATALVHEAYVRIVGVNTFSSKSQFFRATAEAMRRILVDHARKKQADKRGGSAKRVDLPDIAATDRDAELLALDEALDDLDRHDSVAAALVKLRYFSGFSHSEAAELLGLTRRQADGVWMVARAWLFKRIQPV